MQTLKFNSSDSGKNFKRLNATNGGPWHKRHTKSQARTNLADYAAARIPYARNHDSAVAGIYGGPYSHDITCIFPRFEADPYDPASYDFACTDEAILVCLEAGTETFFRLGQTIEHQIKKHGTLPPSDFQKWSVICEHIIRHYNEGWADGFKLNIQYWEIWNEPDLDLDDSPNKRCWGGTKAQFFDFYEIAAKHLKSCFPALKIGGPALAHRLDWAEDFLLEMQKRDVELDFFSWHCYTTNPEKIVLRSHTIRELLDKYGYRHTESILNECNYARNFGDEFINTIKAIHAIKGASFVAACICAAQNAPIDMLMYYDTRPSVFNGAFDFYTYEKLKGYYPLYWYGMFYDMEKDIPSLNAIEDIYALCGMDKNGKVLALVTYYTDNNEAENKRVKIDFGKEGVFEIYLLDEEHDGELVNTTSCTEFDMKPCTTLLLKECENTENGKWKRRYPK